MIQLILLYLPLLLLQPVQLARYPLSKKDADLQKSVALAAPPTYASTGTVRCCRCRSGRILISLQANL